MLTSASSGPAPLRLLPGGSIAPIGSVVRVALLLAAARPARGAASTRLVRMIVVTATGATATGITIVIAVTPVTALGALIGKTS